MASNTIPPVEANEPFLGDELISITISTYGIELHFRKDVLQIGGAFTLSTTWHLDEVFQPAKQQGSVQKLWPLIGQMVTKADWGNDWGDTVELVFDDGSIVRILPCDTGFRGTIFSKSSTAEKMIIEDF